MIKTYSELIKLKTFDERFNYLLIKGLVGEVTFGSRRYLNQSLYSAKNKQWKKARRNVIIRDKGCDLGIDGYEINYRIYVHHINPITYEDLLEMNEKVYSEENLICTSFETHQALHYGNQPPVKELVERRKGDTKLW